MTVHTIFASVVLVVMTIGAVPALGADRAPSERSESRGQARDESEIRDVQARQQEAWNRHDAKAYAALFAVDGDVVNVVGWWWKGRGEIERQLTAAYAVVFRESRLTITDVQVRFLASDVAVAHVRWSMDGAKTPSSIPEPREGIQVQVLQKRGGTWQIATFQNTNSLPIVPFPAEPPSAARSPRP